MLSSLRPLSIREGVPLLIQRGRQVIVQVLLCLWEVETLSLWEGVMLLSGRVIELVFAYPSLHYLLQVS